MIPGNAELSLYAYLEYEAFAMTIGTQTEAHHEGAQTCVEKGAPPFKG